MRKFLTLLVFCTLLPWRVHFAAAQPTPELDTQHVFLITLDGLRWQELFAGSDESLVENKIYVHDPAALKAQFHVGDALARRQTLMPFFWSEIATRGQLYGNRNLGCEADLTNNQVFSYPGYNEILTGKADPAITSNDKIPNKNRTVLEFVNAQPGFINRVAAFASWDVFPYIINETRSGVPVNAGFAAADHGALSPREVFLNALQKEIPSPWSTVRLDAFTHHYAVEYIQKYHPRLVYIAYGETDDFAHDGAYDAYLKSARQTDAFIASLWALVQADPVYKDKTTFVITTDHGRGTVPLDTWRGHGTDITGADEIWMAFLGPDTPALGEVESCSLYQNQVASTVARFLGFDFQAAQEAGPVVESAFN
ncbi:MAG: alkaline phosphatase family protein [Bacteroidota bacterium]